MVRSKTPLYSLTRNLIRPSWNKYNLFNLSRKQLPSIHNKTMYQQKWTAKKETRAYHGDHLMERQFKSLWTPKLVQVASDNPRDSRTTPIASQTYATLEKRLDIALFRALFASSTRQSKQMIVHGKVKVNGKQIKRPGYCLKPGDLFEVNPAAVIMNVSPPRPRKLTDQEDSETAESNAETSTEGGAQATTTTATTPVSNRTRKASEWEEIGRSNFVPKDYMSAFAFVPTYLQVSYETCSAVYLRDPVAKPGSSEVPSPLPASVHALAHNFYQRGR